MAFKVISGSVTAETLVGPGRARVDFPNGAILPADVPAEDVQRALAFGHLEEVPDFDEPPELADPGPEDVPDAPIEVVMAWVGDNPDRASRALAFEHGKGDNARSTLVGKLEPLIQQ